MGRTHLGLKGSSAVLVIPTVSRGATGKSKLLGEKRAAGKRGGLGGCRLPGRSNHAKFYQTIPLFGSLKYRLTRSQFQIARDIHTIAETF